MKRGDVIDGRFELTTSVGAGGMGEVFRARDRETGELVAVKALRASADTDRFTLEAKVLAELRHPGIVRYVASGSTAGTRWLAMEWLDGEDLATRLRRERPSTHESVELVRRAADALGAAHERHIVHRDVKPENLFLCGGRVDGIRLIDFGIARARGVVSTRAATRTGVALGTPGYMSPEQARGDREVDARADVFSLGCVLFECLTGRAAFVGEHVMAILAKILLEEAPRLDEILPDAPLPLVELTARMLAKDKEERPADGREVARALATLARLPTLRPGPVAVGLTPGEARVVSVVLAVRGPIDVHADTLTDGVAEAQSQILAAVSPGAPPPDPWPFGLGRRPAPPGGRAAESTSVAERAPESAVEVQLLAGGTVACVVEGPGAVARAARLALDFGRHPAMRVALATGRAQIQGRLPVGDAIDRAARLVQRAAPVAVDEVSAAMLADRFEIDGVALLTERLETDPARTLLGKRTRCVGRDAELRVLEAYFDACVDESRGRPILVTAPAGVGKSRLAHELVRTLRARERDIDVWVGHGDVMQSGSPLGMIKQALMSTADIRHGEPPERMHQKLLGRVARNVPAADRERVALFLGEITGANAPDVDNAALRAAHAEAIVMADNTRRAWEDFVRAECAARPVLLVLEDLHWGDGATVRYTDSALRNLGELPWMVLALARPEVHEMFPRL